MTLDIDGRHGEGGGSIVRFSIAFAALLNRSVRVRQIRANRPRGGGLRPQHLTGVQLITQLTGGTLVGGQVGSTDLTYHPPVDEPPTPDEVDVEITTAGSVGLVFQALQLAMAQPHSRKTVNVRGGATYGAWAPSVDFIRKVTIPALERFGYRPSVEVHREGYYPTGGAKVILVFHPAQPLQPLHHTTQSPFQTIFGRSVASNHLRRAKVAERQANSAEKILKKAFPSVDFDIQPVYVDSSNPGSGLTIWTDTIVPFGKSGVGKKGLPAEKVGRLVADSFVDDWREGGAVDEHLSDQLIPAMALSPGSSLRLSTLSSHTQTNIWLAEQFLSVKFGTQTLPNEKGIILSSQAGPS